MEGEGDDGSGAAKTTPLNVRVLFFANIKEAVGAREEMFVCAAGAKVKDVFDMVLSKYPQIKPFVEDLSIALNSKYLEGLGETVALSDRDELALIPPVSGG